MKIELPEYPTKEMLEALIWSDLSIEEERKRILEESIKLGTQIVPPVYEMEMAAVQYRRLYNYLKEQSK